MARYLPFRDHAAESALFMRRTGIATLGMGLLTILLLVNLYYLQIHHYQNYHSRSNDNHIKLVPIAPMRGLIYDRNGVLLAENRMRYQLELTQGKVANLAKTLAELRKLLELSDDDIDQFNRQRQQKHRFAPIPLKTSLSDSQVARFAVNQHRFSGVMVQSYPQRYYPHGSAMTHVVGYLAKINPKERKWLGEIGQSGNYSSTHEIGKLGIERYYEQLLHGSAGYEKVEVNSHGRVVRRISQQPPQAGINIKLTLDITLQNYIQDLMRDRRGAVVVMDPRDGGILAMVSSPSYDPNLFIGGITHSRYQELLNNPDRPLVNRATQGLYPPASTVKPFISIGALEEQVITRNSSLFDPGWWQLPGTKMRYKGWKRWGHGSVNLVKAIEESADSFFYQVAYEMGIDRLSSWMRRFGYGEYSGIDLAEESSGTMPTREWKMQRHRQPWYQGDTISVGIGQGYWSATPIQMVKALTILINNGKVKIPHLLFKRERESREKVDQLLPIHLRDPSFWQLAKDGMYGVANRPNGSAWRAFCKAPYKVGVKSGTAQLFTLREEQVYQPEKLAKRLHDHALFIAFAPYQKPEVALAIVMENAGFGSREAAPVVRKILDYILEPKLASYAGDGGIK